MFCMADVDASDVHDGNPPELPIRDFFKDEHGIHKA